jgi:AcrR family transcriptional regulator
MPSVERRRRRARSSLGSVSVGGGEQVSELQRSRMLSSAVAVVSEYGYGRMSVSRVTGRARVSRRTFYDVFVDREDCFLAVFEDAVERASERVVAGYEREGSWEGRVRVALEALLGFFDEEPGVCSLLVVDALGAGPRVLERRAEVLERLGVAVQEGGSRAHSGLDLPPLTGEGVVGAVFSVIHSRLLAKRQRPPLVELLNPLMGMIVLPYQGPVAARKALKHPVPARSVSKPRKRQGARGQAGSVIASLPMRVTYRTLRVLTAIGEQPGASNREVSDAAGVADQGQISKLLGRLERLGLIENTTATTGQGNHHPPGEPNAWRLTPRGKEIAHLGEREMA